MILNPDQIAKLPPELQRAAELCGESAVSHGDLIILALAVKPALTWGLQMQEERDAAIAMHEKEESTPCECCATIATLTRELENSRINHIDANQRNIAAEAEVARLRGELQVAIESNVKLTDALKDFGRTRERINKLLVQAYVELKKWMHPAWPWFAEVAALSHTPEGNK